MKWSYSMLVTHFGTVLANLCPALRVKLGDSGTNGQIETASRDHNTLTYPQCLNSPPKRQTIYHTKSYVNTILGLRFL